MRSPDQPVRRSARLEIAHACALGVWAGSIGTTAFAAAVIFPALKRLDPSIEGYPGADAAHHWLIAGGHIAAPLFAALSWIGVGCFALAGASMLTLAWRARRSGRMPRFMRARLSLLAILAGHVIAYSGFVQPRMQQDLDAYWDAARVGQASEASSYQVAFESRHPAATRVLGSTLLFVVAALVVGFVPEHGRPFAALTPRSPE